MNTIPETASKPESAETITATATSPEDDANGARESATSQDMAQLCRARAATYQLLARLYREEVDDDLLQRMKGMLFPAHSASGLADKGVREIVGYLSSSWENTLTELAVDFARVFLSKGNNAYSAAYPYESVYTSEKRLLMQDAYVDVLARYREEGIVRSEDSNEFEDHIALELEFEQILCTRAAAALDEDDETAAEQLLAVQKSFLNEHLANWFPLLAHDMRRFAKTDFYQGLADYTQGFLEEERDLLDELGLPDDPAAA